MAPMVVIGCALVAFVDIALGLVIGHGFGRWWYHEPHLWVYLAGPLLALLPDADIPLQLLIERLGQRQLVAHRQIIHYPLALVPLFFVVYPWHPFLAWLTVLCVGAHFVHDSIGNAWGIQWLQPFSSLHIILLTPDRTGARRFIQLIPHRDVMARGRQSTEAFVRKRYCGLTPEVARAILSLAGALVILML
ncbi:MAG: metal-dependent hydrolase [bacterium]|nr:metal-dependent hydrolase [bacterium]